jgi:hypothetical protein
MSDSTRRVLAVGLLLAVPALLSSVCVAGDTRPAEVAQPKLRDELIRRMGEDQECRKRTWETFSHSSASELKAFDWNAFIRDLHLDPRDAARLADDIRKMGLTKVSDAAVIAFKKQIETDRANTARMKEIIDRFGWPGKKLVGGQAARAAWVLVQHADYDHPFQKRCLGLLERAAKDGDADPGDFALLTDRVLVADGQKQRYGTQYELVAGKITPRPIEGEGHVDQRRREVGLEPLANYLKTAQDFYNSSSRARQ